MRTYDPHKTTNDVRQANDRHMNLRVLVLSVTGIIALMTLFYVAYNLATVGL